MMNDRQRELDAKFSHVRITFDVPCMTAYASLSQTREGWWDEDNTDDYWMGFDDGVTVPYRIPRHRVTSMVPL